MNEQFDIESFYREDVEGRSRVDGETNEWSQYIYTFFTALGLISMKKVEARDVIL